MFNIHETGLAGLKVIETQHFIDERGVFHKFFSRDEFMGLGLEHDFCEDYYSINKKNVIRGMHFQIPPSDHVKLVYVTSGKIIDVCLDIRKNSQTYGKFFSVELSGDVAKCIYIPKGFAHGFISLEDNTCVHYLQTSCYNKECDCGIAYDSFGYDWNCQTPVVSGRDLAHQKFKDFKSPFTGKKIVLTGSTGLIGKEALKPLQDAGFEVYCLTSKNCNLFDYGAVERFFEHIKPEFLLHFAWITGGDYLTNPINTDYVDASMNMLNVFKKYGGRRAVYAGTCFEYAFKDTPLKETDDLNPQTLYAECKVRLYNRAKKFCEENNISFAWGRIFYVYGHDEKRGRLTSSVIDKLSHGEEVFVKYGQLVRDYMYSRDIASAFVKIVESDVFGAVNVCTGKGVTLEEYVSCLAEKFGKPSLINVQHEQTEQPLKIIGDCTRLLNEVKFSEVHDMNTAVSEIISVELVQTYRWLAKKYSP